jgi:hypothetical protein
MLDLKYYPCERAFCAPTLPLSVRALPIDTNVPLLSADPLRCIVVSLPPVTELVAAGVFVLRVRERARRTRAV